MPTDLPRRELASAAELDTIMLALTSPRRAWVERAYGSRDYRVFIVGDRLRPVPFGAYGAIRVSRPQRRRPIPVTRPDLSRPRRSGPAGAARPR